MQIHVQTYEEVVGNKLQISARKIFSAAVLSLIKDLWWGYLSLNYETK